jgi:hypothetical protein
LPTSENFENSEPGHVAAWPREALHEALTDRIGRSHEDDRDGSGCLLRRYECRCTTDKDHVRHRSHHFRGISLQPTGIGVAAPIFDSNVAALCPPQLLKPLPECSDTGLSFRIVGNRAA